MGIDFATGKRFWAIVIGISLFGVSASWAQRHKAVTANADGSTPSISPPVTRQTRLQPLFGGLTVEQATALIGAPQLDAIAASFASRAEASTFFATKGLEYLGENQPDTAASRLNIAWLLNPQNPAVYRGFGIITSSQPTADAAIALLTRGLALAPTDAMMLSDLGASHLIRYRQTHKKKDLSTGVTLLQQSTTTDPINGLAWEQLAQGYYDQGHYPEAWAAVHKGRALDMSSIDFALITELLAKQPDPEKVFK